MFGQSGCIRAKAVVFGQKWLSLCKNDCIRAELLLSGKIAYIRATVAVYGQSGCIRAKVAVFGQSSCIRA